MALKLWSRRDAMHLMAAALMTPFAYGEDNPWVLESDFQYRMESFYAETESQPKYVWMNREDIMYHDHDYPPSIAGAPDYCAFIHKTWVFNRAMQWVRKDEAILCYENRGILELTGENQVSRWHTGPDNELRNELDFTIWTKRSRRRRDCAVLPAFQFHLGQHPIIELDVDAGDAEWQFCAGLKGRSGAPLISTPWKRTKGTERIDLFAQLSRAGFDWTFPEMHFAIGTWSSIPEKTSELRFRIRMVPHSCLVGCLPVIRTAERAHSQGVPILAVPVDAEGQVFSPNDLRLSVSAGASTQPMEHSDGVWRAQLRDLGTGDYTAILRSEGAIEAQAYVPLRVTDGRFYSMPRPRHWPIRDGKAAGPLTGSYQGTFFFRDVGTDDERMVQTPEEWSSWNRSEPDAEHMHYWESLKQSELNERFQYLTASGFDLLALHSHWGVWERLDAGGQIAPHGAEQLARYLRIAGLHGLTHIQALTSGPYMSPGEGPSYGGTVPYSRYLDERFQTSDFTQPGNNRFDSLFHQYLRDFATLFSDETSIFAITASGEGDAHNGPARTNDTMAVVRSIDRNHIFLAETIDEMRELPNEQCKNFQQDRFGGRTYSCGEFVPAEYDLGVYFKFLQMAYMYMAEGSWSAMPRYNQFHYEVIRDFRGSPRCWTGTERYRIRLRDTLWLGMVHLLPLLNTWDEQIANDEHLLLRSIRKDVDWGQAFAHPLLALRVDDACANEEGAARQNVARYEEAFVHLGLMYRLIPADERDAGDAIAVLDARQPFRSLGFESEGGTLPDNLKQSMPLHIGSGYACSYVWSQDKRTLLAYLYNTTNHESDYMWLCGNYHRTPRSAPFQLKLENLPALNLRVHLYDLNTKELLSSMIMNNGKGVFDRGLTKHDFVLLVTPA
jgi:hypothetical protein